MEHINLSYSDPKLLERLVKEFPENGYDFSVVLMPDVDEIVKSSNLKPLSCASRHLCDKYKVLPFGLSLNFSRTGSSSPDLYYLGLDEERSKNWRESINHLVFLENRRWYKINMHDAEEPEDIQAIKKAIKEFVDKGYRVVALRGYQKGTSILAASGEIAIHGSKPEMFKGLVERLLSN